MGFRERGPVVFPLKVVNRRTDVKTMRHCRTHLQRHVLVVYAALKRPRMENKCLRFEKFKAQKTSVHQLASKLRKEHHQPPQSFKEQKSYQHDSCLCSPRSLTPAPSSEWFIFPFLHCSRFYHNGSGGC